MKARWVGVALGMVVMTLDAVAFGQVLVLPRRAAKSRVRYFDFAWRHVDILVGLDANTLDADRVEVEILTDPEKLKLPPLTKTGSVAKQEWVRPPEITTSTSPKTHFFGDLEAPDTSTAGLEIGPLTGGVRLFFYEDERKAAEHAAASIEESYRFLVQKFRYIPEKTFPYILYNSYQEFLQTNVFPVQEGILGVTATRGDLRLTLPYFGDFKYFRDVSVHEMTHQFTIQKVRSYAERADVGGDPLERFPLWYIEGLAEFYAKSGLDSQAEMLVRDILLNPSVEEGYAMLDFWADRPQSGLWTYKVGQIRCVFLAETYGPDLLQRILERSPWMVASSEDVDRVDGFRGLVEKLTGDDARTVAIKFEAWLKTRAFANYLATKQRLESVSPMHELPEYVDSIHASPNGEVLMIRSYDLTTGRAELSLVHHKAARDRKVIVSDGSPGAESLHPVSSRTFTMTNDKVAYLAEARGSDILYVEGYSYETRIVPPTEDETAPPNPARRNPSAVASHDKVAQPDVWEAKIRLHDRFAYRLMDEGIYAAYSPTFSPDGTKVAFIGLSKNGHRDLFVLTPGEGDSFSLVQLTDDAYAERDAAWGIHGIVFSSDRTGNRAHNLFRIDPARPEQVERLTVESRDHFDPIVTSDGRVFFSAYDNGSANIYEALAQGWVRRTDIITGFFSLSPGPAGGLWALLHHSGRRNVVQVPAKSLSIAEVRPRGDDPSTSWLLPESSLSAAVEYNALLLRNWELGTIFGFLGAGPGGVFGQLIASANDRLHNHSVVMQVLVLGSLDLTDGHIMYLNQTGRMTWGVGPFQALQFRVDRTFSAEPLKLNFFSYERFFGVHGLARYPLDRYLYLQGLLQVGGASYALDRSTRDFLRNPVQNRTQNSVTGDPGRDLLPEWEAQNAGVRFQTQASLILGYDTIRYHPSTGPVAGNAAMLEGKLATQPFDEDIYGSLRFDAEQYLPIFGRTNAFLRVGAGSTFGGKIARQFYLSSFDTLRGVPFATETFLIGRSFLFSTAEIQVPLNLLIRLLIFSDIEGIAGFDFGTVADDFDHFFDKRVFDFVLGFNLGLGPLVFRLHFAKPIDIGAPLPNGDGSWVTNFSLTWLYL